MLTNDYSDSFVFHIRRKTLINSMHIAKETLLWMIVKTELQTMCIISKHLYHERWWIIRWYSFIFSYFPGKLEMEKLLHYMMHHWESSIFLLFFIHLLKLSGSLSSLSELIKKNYIICLRIMLWLFDLWCFLKKTL